MEITYLRPLAKVWTLRALYTDFALFVYVEIKHITIVICIEKNTIILVN